MLPIATHLPLSTDLALGRVSTFEIDLTLLEEKYTALWQTTTTDPPALGETWTWRRRRRTERDTNRLIDEVEDVLRAFPGDGPGQTATRRRIQETLRKFGRTCLALPAEQCAVIFSDDYFDVTAEFARRVRAFDSRVEVHDLFQALRNLWIMNLFQLFLDRDISLTPAMTGYSLLYPYTDNRLDDPDLAPAGKKRFCQRLERRLEGRPVEAEGDHERAVFDLVGMIESQYDRDDFPAVYLSLLAIHRAQVASLRQQSAGANDDILGLSIAKGGTSVLADGYLVAGDLDFEEADFFFGYGIVLQLIDDLQDVEQDLEAGHRTLFSCRAAEGPLDEIAGRLHHFLEAVLKRSRRFSEHRFDVLKDVVRRNCGQLIVQAAAHRPQFFSSGFLRRLETYSPVRFAYARKKRSEILRRYGKLNRRLKSETRLGSLFEALG